jgi:hypothetical protein
VDEAKRQGQDDLFPLDEPEDDEPWRQPPRE